MAFVHSNLLLFPVVVSASKDFASWIRCSFIWSLLHELSEQHIWQCLTLFSTVQISLFFSPHKFSPMQPLEYSYSPEDDGCRTASTCMNTKILKYYYRPVHMEGGVSQNAVGMGCFPGSFCTGWCLPKGESTQQGCTPPDPETNTPPQDSEADTPLTQRQTRPRWPLKRAVCILLECILVSFV